MIELIRHPRDDRLAELTERELDVLRLVGKGMTNKEIAGNLVLADKTVKFHMTNILRKLHVRNRVEAALLVQQEDPDARSSPARRGSA